MGIFDDFLAAHPIQAEDADDVEVDVWEKAKKIDLESVPCKDVEDVDGNAPKEGGEGCEYKKIVKKAFTSRARDQHSQHFLNPLKSLKPRKAPTKKPHQHHQHLRKSTSWMTMPIICGGVQCNLAYLPSSGGLVCELNHQPVLMMSSCPAGKWDRGFAVFAVDGVNGSMHEPKSDVQNESSCAQDEAQELSANAQAQGKKSSGPWSGAQQAPQGT